MEKLIASAIHTSAEALGFLASQDNTKKMPTLPDLLEQL